jgi:hypothetical protein
MPLGAVERAVELLEDKLRSQFAPENFAARTSLRRVVLALWSQTIQPENKGVLLLTMDMARRAWSGSARAKKFYLKQQRLWTDLFSRHASDRDETDDILQTFLGAVLTYLISGDPRRGKRLLDRATRSRVPRRSRE